MGSATEGANVETQPTNGALARIDILEGEVDKLRQSSEEHGVRLAKIEQHVASVDKEVGGLKATTDRIDRTLRGDDSSDGIVHEVRGVRKAGARVERLVWVVAGLILAAIVERWVH